MWSWFFKPLQKFDKVWSLKVSAEKFVYKAKDSFRTITFTQSVLLSNGVAFATICVSVLAMFKGYQSLKLTKEEQKEKQKAKHEATAEYQRAFSISQLQKPWKSSIIEKEMNCKVLHYVHREEFLDELEKARITLQDGKVLILVGAKGTGKSQLAYHAFYNKPGIVYCFLPSYVTRSTVDAMLLDAAGFTKPSVFTPNALQYLRSLLVDLTLPSGHPVIVVEIERDSNEDVVHTVFRSLKYLSSVARGVVIMTDPTHAIGITPDLDRRRFIWISDFTEEQARRFLDGNGMREKVCAEMSADERNRYPVGTEAFEGFYKSRIDFVFKNVGTRPLTLHCLSSDGLPIQSFVEFQLLSARNRVNNLVIEYPQFIPILKDFMGTDSLKQEHVTKKLGTSLQKLAPILKGYQVISYDLEHEVFLLHSTSVRVAAQEYIRDLENSLPGLETHSQTVVDV